MDNAHWALWFDAAVFFAVAWRIHTSDLYESGMMLRIAVLIAYAWLLISDIDNLIEAFNFMPFAEPGTMGRGAVTKGILLIGISLDLWRHQRHKVSAKNAQQ